MAGSVRKTVLSELDKLQAQGRTVRQPASDRETTTWLELDQNPPEWMKTRRPYPKEIKDLVNPNLPPITGTSEV